MKKEAIEVLKNRRSIRKYKTEQIKKEELDLVLELGTYAPTSRGLQSPVIVAVQDSEIRAKLSRLNAQVIADVRGVSVEDVSDPYFAAPTIVLVFAPKSTNTQVEDGSAVMTQLCLAAYAAGLGSCWVNRERQMFETAEGRELMAVWGLSEDYVGVGGLSLGYADGDFPAAKERKADYIVYA